MSQVTIITGSAEDELKMITRVEELIDAGISVHTTILPKECTPEELKECVAKSNSDLFMVGSSQALALSGLVAAFTNKPVVSVPLNVDPEDDALDLFSIEGLPMGTPCANTFMEDIGTAISIVQHLLKKA